MSLAPARPVAPETPARTYPATGRAIALLVVTALFVLTQIYAAIPLISPISAEFGHDVTFALSTVFSVCYAIGFLIRGPAADQYGRKRIMVIGLACVTLATIGCGFTSSVPALGILRGVQGLTASSFASVALAYLSEATRPERRPMAVGAMSTSFLVAGIFDQVFAAAVASTIGRAWVFFLSGVVLALSLIGVVILVRESAAPPVSGGLRRRFAAIGHAAMGRPVLLLSAAQVTLLLSFVAMYTALGPQLTALGLDAGQVIWLRLIGLPGMFASLLAGPLAHRVGYAGVARIGCAIAVVGLLAQSALSGQLIGLAVASLVFVSGIALAIPAMITLFGESALPNRAGGIAMNGFVLFLGASIGPLTARLNLDFGVVLLLLAGLLVIAAGSLTGFMRLPAHHTTTAGRTGA